jgi:peptidoglycan/LPS O-acetylase OafA/YrhL
MNNNKRLDYLDSLRGIAALAVVFFHLLITIRWGYFSNIRPYIETMPLRFLWDGAAAVSFFFVLSGFVLSYGYLRGIRKGAQHSQVELGYFYISRLIRLVLPYVGVLCLSTLAYHYCFEPFNEESFFTKESKEHWDGSSAKADYPWWKQAVLFIPGTKHFYIPQGWTLTVEAIASLLMPFMILLAMTGVRYLVVFVFLILIVFDLQRSVFEFKFIFHFSLGILVAYYFQEIQQYVSSLTNKAKIFIFIFGLYFYLARFPIVEFLRIPVDRKDIWYLTGFGSAVLLIFFIGSVRAQKILTVRPLLYLGKTSYSLYLSHYIILQVFLPPLVSFMRDRQLDGNDIHLIAFLSSLMVIMLFSHICYMLFEYPSLLISKRFKKMYKKS